MIAHPSDSPRVPPRLVLGEVRYSLPDLLEELKAERAVGSFGMEKLDQHEIGHPTDPEWGPAALLVYGDERFLKHEQLVLDQLLNRLPATSERRSAPLFMHRTWYSATRSAFLWRTWRSGPPTPR